MKFTKKVAVVTGAARGIGAAVAKKFASEGANVAIFDINIEAAEQFAQSLGGEAIAVGCDVSNEQEVKKAFEAVHRQFGRVDILINNAGVIRDNLLFKMSESDWDTVVDIHLKGAFLCVKEAQKYMVEQKYGKIVNVSSTSALGNRGQVNYSSAKAGLQGMTRTLAIELGPFGVNVNCIAPGFIETEMTKKTAERIGITLEQMVENVSSQLAIQRAGKPEDIANVAGFLCSDEASYVTGQVIYVAGKPTV
ncbi:SDR family NAD(P)-dependent oxidoreductase [Desertibacillus haloalkaliphilus]|uniref:SDR family NAD(P)-dependent oxidoreductase n=1 Tax=Desertibacillus haloalkaliphilus TaxID=1328930 RepID=UPI001C26F678|nr:SDR family NAD(P)-dependent oxidoreductase [Desertibacillus haloalkaliphilus]MBU8907969.1 SDR family oxidoreductase [Desertibacillus haloalkaliphilus]